MQPYLDEGVIQMAQEIAVSAKCGRPGVCNAIENLIVHQSHLPSLLPKITEQLTEKGCRIFADDQAKVLWEIFHLNLRPI